MKIRKITIGIVLAIFVVAFIGVVIFMTMNSKKREDTVEEGHYIEVEPQEEEVKYTDIAKASVGDIVAFGDYEGEIAWNVLEEEKDKLMLISSKCITQRAYHSENTAITWQQCEMRKWLNNIFYNSAFSDMEKDLILKTKVKNQDNAAFHTKGGKNTSDFVYLLSIDEADQYFSETSARMTVLRNGNAIWWWLRSPGFQENDAANVGDYGTINGAGHKVHDEFVVNGGVRPVIWISR